MSAPPSQEKFTPAFLLHLYDELSESKPDSTLKDYEDYLILWGMDRKKAKVCCSRISPNKKGRLSREDVCNGLGFAPEQPAGLRDIEILCRDMPIRKSESIQVIVLNVLNSKSSYVDIVTEIKRQVENIYGTQWNVFVASGRYWGLCTHKAGGNLVFAYNGVVYGIYQSPERDFEDSPFGINSSYALTSDMGDSLQPEKLVHLFDELTETQPGVPTAEYKKYLVKWGVDTKTSTRICNMADPTGSGRVTRDALCEGLRCWPNQPAILKNVQLLDSDMSLMKRESVTLLILEVISERKSKKETIDEIKKRLQAIYGEGWSVYIAEGRYWSVCSHRPGSNLAFLYQNTVYGVYQIPNTK
nr:tegumental antigen [Hymenolepis microstoma]